LDDLDSQYIRKIDYIYEITTMTNFWLYSFDFTLFPLIKSDRIWMEKKRRQISRVGKKNTKSYKKRTLVYKKRTEILEKIKM
jgi:hypothetical protein